MAREGGRIIGWDTKMGDIGKKGKLERKILVSLMSLYVETS